MRGLVIPTGGSEVFRLPLQVEGGEHLPLYVDHYAIAGRAPREVERAATGHDTRSGGIDVDELELDGPRAAVEDTYRLPIRRPVHVERWRRHRNQDPVGAVDAAHGDPGPRGGELRPGETVGLGRPERLCVSGSFPPVVGDKHLIGPVRVHHHHVPAPVDDDQASRQVADAHLGRRGCGRQGGDSGDGGLARASSEERQTGARDRPPTCPSARAAHRGRTPGFRPTVPRRTPRLGPIAPGWMVHH